MQPTVGDLMQREPVTIGLSDTLAAAKALMEQSGVHQLPVLQNGDLVGILSNRDLHAHTGYFERTKVDAAMTWTPVTVSRNAPAEQALRLLMTHSFNALPVVDDGRLVGILSRTDLLRLLADFLARERAA